MIMDGDWTFSRRHDEAATAWELYRSVTSRTETAPPALFSAGFTMGVSAAEAVRRALDHRSPEQKHGSCWDAAPSVGHDPMPARCELTAGHLGAHRSGSTEWMRGTPTDDEREALARLIHDETGEAPEESGFVADAILAAGFRRPEVPEPSAELSTEERHTLVEGAVDAIERSATNRTHAYNIWNTIASDERFVRAIMTLVPNRGQSEPQGEPSDAQRYRAAIEDALPMIGLFRAWNTSPEQIENVRVILARALDAAGGVR